MRHIHWNLNFTTDTQTGSTGLVFLVIKENDYKHIDYSDKQSKHSNYFGLMWHTHWDLNFYTRHTDRIDRFSIPRNKTIPSIIYFKGHSDTQSTSRQINTTRSDNSWTGIKWRNVWEWMGVRRLEGRVRGSLVQCLMYIIPFTGDRLISAMD